MAANALKPLNMGRSRDMSEFLEAGTLITTVNLVAATAKTVTVPPLARAVIFKTRNVEFVVDWTGTGTAAEPVGDVIDGTACDPDPIARFGLTPGSTISLFSTAGGRVTMYWYGMGDG